MRECFCHSKLTITNYKIDSSLMNMLTVAS